ncbi:MAG TPA: response regulator [Rhizomicrobium sp.]|jgi:CheY-like chemotaxis protein|nr:response regulator [Rhizomicrobium sp.]
MAAVLVVEDEPLVRMVAVEVLRDSGYEVLEAGDGLEALEVLRGSAVDVLITDVQMPRMNGYQLAEAAIDRWPGLKVLIVTGYARENVSARIASAAIHTIHKPFDIDRLPLLVAELLAKH